MDGDFESEKKIFFLSVNLAGEHWRALAESL